ncbi:AMP binding protein [Vararia minispora EC-137]|uniref:AMP binding protein n=1 Tax=Vararia minispora EC-137 TaxID=1314806 RepID=A0ACB8QWF5_9AGAM|nr:AMP binding protein [Vararia minispora EC-137]
MTIYQSPYRPVFLPRQSLWSFVFHGPHHPSLPAFVEAPTGRTLTRSELSSLTLQVAYGLRHVLSAGERAKRGDTVMIFSPNSLAWPIVLLGIIANGSRATLANSAYTSAELQHQYTDSGARVIFIHPTLVGVALDMFKRIGISETEARKRLVLMDLSVKSQDGILGLQDLLGRGQASSVEPFDGHLADETALLCYSSGTTGKPKGVETTHYNLTSLLSILEPVKAVESGKDIMLATLPYYHIYGVVKLLLYEVAFGVSTVIMPRFHPEDFCRAIERYGVTVSFIVPPIVLALVHHPAVLKYNMKTLVYISSGAAPLGADVVTACRKRLASVGASISIGQGYGLTETSPVTHIVPRAVANERIGTVGLLLPNLEARLVIAEREDGEALEDATEGKPGELWVRGPTVMKGYLNNPAATLNAITPSGWFKTGDIGIIDKDGYCAIVDRKKELIKYKLESVLLQHPEIVDAAVIGIEDPSQATELPRAYVVHKHGSDAPASFPQDVQKWIETRVAKHKYLHGGVILVGSVPKSAAGKILRRQLRDLAKAESNAKTKL